MSQVTGVVKKIMTTPWQDKLLHGFSLENDERLFGTGTQKVADVAPGNLISFTVEKNPKGRWQVDAKSVKLEQKMRAPEAPSQEQTKEEKNKYWVDKDKTIELQSCRNSAIELVNVLLTQSAIKTPTKVDEKYDFVLALVDEITNRFVQANEDFRNPAPELVETEPTVEQDKPAEDWQE